MSNFNWSGLWNSGTTYQINTFVTWKNVVYVSLNPNISSEPSNLNTDWDIVVYGQGNSYIDRTPLPTITPPILAAVNVTPAVATLATLVIICRLPPGTRSLARLMSII